MAFKEKYVLAGRVVVPADFEKGTVRYYTNKKDANGNGSYISPAPSNIMLPATNSVLSGGVHKSISISIAGYVDCIIGQGMNNTVIDEFTFQPGGGTYGNFYYTAINGIINTSITPLFTSCHLTKNASWGGQTNRIRLHDSLSYIGIPKEFSLFPPNVNNSFVDVTSPLYLSMAVQCPNSLVDSCDVDVTSLGNAANYLAFAKCNFKIGSETAFTALIGSNAEARKANFIARCEAQGISCPSVPDLGITAKLQRWDFEDESIVGGAVIDGSPLAEKNDIRGFHMGYTKPIRTIPLSTESTTLGHISENNTGFEVSGDALFVDEKIVMTAPNALSIDSSVIPLDGRMQLDALDVVHTFSGVYGIHLRDGASDIASQNIALLRTVDALPPAKIRNGALLASFWYLVTYDTPEVKETGYIEYNGKRHYCGDAILVKAGVTAFTIPASFANKVHLRECWHTNFAGGKNPNNESAAFWGGEKLKPNWLPVVLDDLRAQFKNDNESTGTIKEVGGVPMTSGAESFYPQILDGVPVFPLYGSFVQIRINAMTGDER